MLAEQGTGFLRSGSRACGRRKKETKQEPSLRDCQPARMWGLLLSIVVGAVAVAAPFVMQASPATLTATVIFLASASVLLLTSFIAQLFPSKKAAPSASPRSSKVATKTKPLTGQRLTCQRMQVLKHIQNP